MRQTQSASIEGKVFENSKNQFNFKLNINKLIYLRNGKKPFVPEHQIGEG
jgi:hypothetical protein